MNIVLYGAAEGHHTAAALLSEAIQEATVSALRDHPLPMRALDAVTGGTADDVYWASSSFFDDLRTDPFDA